MTGLKFWLWARCGAEQVVGKELTICMEGTFLNKKMSRTLQYHWLREDTSVHMSALGEASTSLQLHRSFPSHLEHCLLLNEQWTPPG